MNRKDLEQYCNEFKTNVSNAEKRGKSFSKQEKVYRALSFKVFTACENLHLEQEKDQARTAYVDKDALWEVKIVKSFFGQDQDKNTIYNLFLIKNDYDECPQKPEEIKFADVMENSVTIDVMARTSRNWGWNKNITDTKIVKAFVNRLVEAKTNGKM